MIYPFRARGGLMNELYSWWAEFVLHHPLKIPLLWSSPLPGLHHPSFLSPLVALCQSEVRDFWQKAVCSMYFSQSPAAGGGDHAVKTLLCWCSCLGWKICLLPLPKLGLGNCFLRCLCISNRTSQRLLPSCFCISKRVY